jgi:hypothetical protein
MEVIGQLKQGKTPDPALRNSKSPTAVKPKTSSVRVGYTPEQRAKVIRRYQDLLQIYNEKTANKKLYQEFSNINKSTLRKWRGHKETPLIFATTGKKLRGKRRIVKNKKKAKFPKEEDKLWDQFKLRRMERLPVNREWIRTTMKGILQQSKPEGYLKFTASPGWVAKWIRRYRVSLRLATNTKHKNYLERLPGVKSFHSKVKTFRRSGTQRCPIYGRFPAKCTFSGIKLVSISSRFFI